MENLYENFLIKYCEDDIKKHTEILNDRKWKLRHLKFQAIMGKRNDPAYRMFFIDLYNYSGIDETKTTFDAWLLQPKWWNSYAEEERINDAMTNIIDFYEAELYREGGNQYGW